MTAFLAVLYSIWSGYRALPTTFHVVTWVALAFICGWISGCHHAGGRIL